MDIDNSTIDELKDKVKRDSLYIKKLEDDIADKDRINEELQKKINDYESPTIKVDEKDYSLYSGTINWASAPSSFSTNFSIGTIGSCSISSNDSGIDVNSVSFTHNYDTVLTDKNINAHIDDYMLEITEDGFFGFISSFSKENVLLRKIYRVLKK